MERTGVQGGSGRRTSYVVFACLWATLGVLSLADGRTWLGVAMLVLALAQLAAWRSPRVAAWGEAPLFGRRK